MPNLPPPTLLPQTGCDLVLECTISAAAVARGFTSYFAVLFGMGSDALRIPCAGLMLDPCALLIVGAETALLCYGIRESSNFNIAVNAVNLFCIVFVLIVGATQVDTANYRPFLPFGTSGVFAGASIVFFSFIGFDTVATAAEETIRPERDLPIGILGSLSICTVLYAGMCAVITGMVSYSTIDLNAPFSVVFVDRGMQWAASLVAAGALTGIITSLLGGLFGQPRVYAAMARDGLLPAWLAEVHPTRGTPVNAQLVTGATAGLFAFLIDIDILAQLVSIGTLCIFCFVCAVRDPRLWWAVCCACGKPRRLGAHTQGSFLPLFRRPPRQAVLARRYAPQEGPRRAQVLG